MTSVGLPGWVPSQSSASGSPDGATPRNSAIAVWDPHAYGRGTFVMRNNIDNTSGNHLAAGYKRPRIGRAPG
jgi:hypothetical protein